MFTSIGFTLLIRTMAHCDLFGFQLNAFVAAKIILRSQESKSMDGDLLVWVTMKCSHNAAHLYWYGLVLSVFSVFCFLFSTSGPATQIDASLRRYVMACKAPSDKGYFSRSLDL